MADVDLCDRLLALAIVTHDQVEASAAIPPDVATTVLGRLIAAGAPVDKVMAEASRDANIPLATQTLQQIAHVVEGIAPAAAAALRDLVAAPVARDANGIVDVIIASADAVPSLDALGLTNRRVHLADENAVRWLLERVLPPPRESGPQMALDVMDQIAMVKRVAAAPAEVALGPAIELIPAPKAPRTLEEARAEAAAARAERPPLERPPPEQHRIGREIAHDDLAELPAEPPSSRGRGRTGVDEGAPRARPRFPVPVIAGAAAVGLVIVIVAVVVAVRGHNAGPPESPAQHKARAFYDKANESAKNGDLAWAIAQYSMAMDADPASPLAAEARLGRAAAEIANTSPVDASLDIDALINAHKPGDPVRARAEALRKRLPH